MKLHELAPAAGSTKEHFRVGRGHGSGNGKTAGKLFHLYQSKQIGMEAVVLPSTSPANAAFSLDKLIEIWENSLNGNRDSRREK